MNRKAYTAGLLLATLLGVAIGVYFTRYATPSFFARLAPKVPAATTQAAASEAAPSTKAGYDSSGLPCTQPDTMERYTCFIKIAGEGAAVSLNMRDHSDSDRAATGQWFMAIEAMNLVRTLASSARYSWYKRNVSTGLAVPNMSQQTVCLDYGFGICGNHQFLFLEFMRRLDIAARSISFWYTDPDLDLPASHAAAEVMIGGRWRYVDITWGSYWLSTKDDDRTALSLDEILAGKGVRQTGTTDVWYIAQKFSKSDPFVYLRGRHLQITRNGGGTLDIDLNNREEQFKHIPSYIGTIPGQDPLALQVTSKAQNLDLAVTLSGAANCANSRLRIGEQVYDITPGTIAAHNVKDGDRITVEGEDKNCYAVLSTIKADNR